MRCLCFSSVRFSEILLLAPYCYMLTRKCVEMIIGAVEKVTKKEEAHFNIFWISQKNDA